MPVVDVPYLGCPRSLCPPASSDGITCSSQEQREIRSRRYSLTRHLFRPVAEGLMQLQDSTQRHPTACRTCRRRGRKCDKLLPTCQSCNARGSPCEGYVTRWPGVAARGRLAGKTVPVNPGRLLPEEQSATRVPTRIDSVDQNHQDDLGPLIDYYAHELGTIIYLGSSPSDNPYLRYIIPMTKTDHCIRLVIAASASCHLAARFHDETMNRKSRELRVSALKILRRRVESEPTSINIGTLATILMMIQLDMCSGDCCEFEAHLPVARLLACSNPEELKDRAFFRQRLAWLDIMRSTTSSHLPTFTSVEIKSIIGYYTTPWGREWGCDVFPCPVELFEYIADATMLYKREAASQPFSPNLIHKANLITQRVSSWKMPPTLRGYKMHVVSAYHAGIMLYVIRLFGLAQHSAISVDFYKDTIFGHIEAVPAASSWSYSMLWPILQAGFWLTEDDDARRRWVRELLDSMSSAVGCRHFGTARETLDFVWKDKCYYNSITAGEQGSPLIIS